MRNSFLPAILFALVATDACASSVPNRPVIPGTSISQDELDIYETMLASWFGKEQRKQRVDKELSAAPSQNDSEVKDCTKGLSFPSADPASKPPKSLAGVHFRGQIDLVNGSRWKPADPGTGIANGKSVDDAVKEGFAASLMSFSRIAFSSDGRDALVKIGVVCGSLCGSGSTVHLHKESTHWLIANRCGNWMS